MKRKYQSEATSNIEYLNEKLQKKKIIILCSVVITTGPILFFFFNVYLHSTVLGL